MSLDESPCRSGSAHQTIGGVCAGRRFPGKHALLLISLTVLRLRAGRLRGRPPPRVSGIRGSDPPRSACPDRHRGGLACAQPCHPPLGGRSRTISPCRKAVQRREETADHQFVGGREPVWPAPSSEGPGAALRTAPTLGGGSAAGKGEP